LVANIEVMQILSERIQERKSKRKPTSNPKLRHRDWIEEQVHGYLKRTPCMQDYERAPELVAKLRADPSRKKAGGPNGFGLTDAEGLQILNFMPQESVELHLMIEDLQSRMSDERQDMLLSIIGSYSNTMSTDVLSTKMETKRTGDADHLEYVDEPSNINGDVKMKTEPLL